MEVKIKNTKITVKGHEVLINGKGAKCQTCSYFWIPLNANDLECKNVLMTDEVE